MKYFIIFLFVLNFCFADEAKPAKWWRAEIRMPYTGQWPCKHRNHGDHKCSTDLTIPTFLHPFHPLHPNNPNRKISFEEFWKTITCDINCKRPASECPIISKYKDQVKFLWEKTSQTKNVKIFIFLKPKKGAGLGFRLYELPTELTKKNQ
mgnify:CR=1 FL=1|tara:strand:+ start:912 stop:1361 length:450 start_codon:yes stop_codon:yes gene_type:complete